MIKKLVAIVASTFLLSAPAYASEYLSGHQFISYLYDVCGSSSVDSHGDLQAQIDFLINKSILTENEAYRISQNEFDTLDVLYYGMIVNKIYYVPEGHMLDLGNDIPYWAKRLGIITKFDVMEERPTEKRAAEIFESLNSSPYMPYATALIVGVNVDAKSISSTYNTRNQVVRAVQKVDDQYLYPLRSHGWRIIVVPDIEDIFPDRESSIGLCLYSNRTIYIESSRYVMFTTVHEIAHAWYYEWDSDAKSQMASLRSKEGDSAASVIREYTDSSLNEFFADVFAYLYLNSDKPDVINDFKEACPLTYEFFKNEIMEVA